MFRTNKSVTWFRKCARCDETKPLHEDSFSPGWRDGFREVCKLCEQKTPFIKFYEPEDPK
jgi:hypothetical protein